MAHHLLEAMSRWILQKGYFYLAFGVLSIYKCVVLVVVFVCLWACAFKMCNKCAISNYWVCVSTSITQQLHTTWLWIGGWILLRSSRAEGLGRLLFVWIWTNCSSIEIFENFSRSMCMFCEFLCGFDEQYVVAADCVCVLCVVCFFVALTSSM